MKIVITGGCGFIGTNLASFYSQKGHEVLLFDNLSRKGEKNLKWLKKNTHAQFRKGDIRNYKLLKKSFRNADVVFHMASQVAVTTSVKNPREDFEINALGTLNVLEAARAQSKPPIIFYASTNKVYGQVSLKVSEGKTRFRFRERKYLQGVREDFPVDFYSPYGCSKGIGDQYTRDYHRIYGLKTVVLRQSCIYGSHQFGNEDQGWVAFFAKQILKKRPITIYGTGKQVRDILYISDLLACYDQALKKINQTQGQIYNIGGGKDCSVSLLELIGLIERLTGNQVKLKYDKERPGDQKVFYVNFEKAKKDFAWQPKVNVEQGVMRLLEWLKTHE